MNKMKMIVDGRTALVDEDQVKLIKKKELLVQFAKELKSKSNTMSAAEHATKMSAVVTKIIRLNRRMRSSVQFI